MAYTLAGTAIKRPKSMTEQNSMQMAEVRTLSGAVNRDLFGANKRVWSLDYETITPADYTVIKAIHTSYQTAGTPQTWAISEANYTVSQVNVHVDIVSREFNMGGNQYVSGFTLVLREA